MEYVLFGTKEHNLEKRGEQHQKDLDAVKDIFNMQGPYGNRLIYESGSSLENKANEDTDGSARSGRTVSYKNGVKDQVV